MQSFHTFITWILYIITNVKVIFIYIQTNTNIFIGIPGATICLKRETKKTTFLSLCLALVCGQYWWLLKPLVYKVVVSEHWPLY